MKAADEKGLGGWVGIRKKADLEVCHHGEKRLHVFTYELIPIVST